MDRPGAKSTAAAQRDGSAPLRIGVSRCLLGDRVRYDGGERRHPFVAEVLARHVTLVPVCPEVEVGMSVPREPVRLEGDGRAPRMVGLESHRDHTRSMNAYARRRVRELERAGVSGYLLQSKSPSCGLGRVKVYRGEHGRARKIGVGLFAAALVRRLPLLPVEEESALDSAPAREGFLESVFAYRRWRRFREQRFSIKRLAEFHAVEELLVLAHSPAGYREMGAILASAGKAGARATTRRYGEAFLHAMAVPATPARHAAVLRALARDLAPAMDVDSRADFSRVIGQIRAGRAPLLEALVLARHHAAAAGREALVRQSYLDLDPLEALLRWHA